MLVYFPNLTFLYALMLALILLNLYFVVILFFFYHFSFYEPILFSKRFAFDCGLRRWINTKFLVVYLYPIADKYFLTFWEDNALIFWNFPWFFLYFLILHLTISHIYIAHYFNWRVLRSSMLSLIIIHQKIGDWMLKIKCILLSIFSNYEKILYCLVKCFYCSLWLNCPGVPLTK